MSASSRVGSQTNAHPQAPGGPPQPQPVTQLQPMTSAHLDAVLPIEQAAYPFPWTRGNFVDSLASGYEAQVLIDAADHRVIGYFLAMQGVDEVHLLNLTVAPAAQGRGHGRAMLNALVAWCRQRQLPQLWLEVRLSNPRAQAIYRRYGFTDVGTRRGYYPAANQQREDACVMNLDLASSARASPP